MGRSQSTLSREIQRNQTSEGLYLPDTAQQKMRERHAQAKPAFGQISEAVLHEIKQRLGQYHSPEQIAGRLKREGHERVSHETIYKLIDANYLGMGEYQQYLRQKRRKRRERKTQSGGRFQVGLGLSIDP
jgi:IS30 family transposase